jgi:hypothetical protein
MSIIQQIHHDKAEPCDILLKQSLIKPHGPISVMLGLDPGIQAFWLPWSSQGMTNMRLYYC